jgi:hypothetical protein
VALNKGHHVILKDLQVLFHAKQHHNASSRRAETEAGLKGD